MTAGAPARSGNLVLRILDSPLHALLSGHICKLEYTGAVTGVHRSLPVEYAADGDRLLVLAARAASKRWWRNFTGAGRTLTVTVGRRVHDAHAVAIAPGDPGYALQLASYKRHRKAPQDPDHRLVVIRLLDT
ncbi:nitroreductase/quinone reductase family protein [Dactylosporangium sp. NPDC005555]|uniref:nitroreductase/quinone reductase family protein n=1 Tax=Dactylosporangium sp. NPDC005555 TaxID=3154889 RepID=UPI0033BA1549